MSDPAADAAFIEFAEDALENLVPSLQDSMVMVSFVPTEVTDIKFAVELGVAIMLDKPLIIVVQNGTKVPSKILACADRILEVNRFDKDEMANLQHRLYAVLQEMEQEAQQ